ncbi:ubiquitin-conjugating enzyme 32 [Wolffia australiana]
MAEEKYNLRNPAVKRILQEVKEMHANPSDDFMSLPLEENIFEWQFAIIGPRDSEFEGGIYHGRIQLPAEYPFKPPSFMLLTPNGRFETQTKICLSISNHHPEHWQPSWSVRTALVALIAFMPTSPDGAIGSLDYKKEERRALAIKSREAPPKFGAPERQKLIDEIHEYLLSKAPPVPALTQVEPPVVDPPTVDQENVDQPEPRVVEEVREVRVNAGAGGLRLSFTAGLRIERRLPPGGDVGAGSEPPRPAVNDRWLTYAAVALTVAIVAMLVKKFFKTSGIGDGL